MRLIFLSVTEASVKVDIENSQVTLHIRGYHED